MIQKVRTSFTFTSQHLKIKNSNIQIDSHKMYFKMRSLKKVKSATNLHTSVLGPFQILNMSDKQLVHELQPSQYVLESNKKKKEESVLCQCFSCVRDEIEIRFFLTWKLNQKESFNVYFSVLFFSLIILLLNHRARQNLSQWLVGYVVAWTCI